MSDMIEVKVPDIGDFKDVPVIEVMVAVGDAVRVDSPLIALESEKATMEVPSPAAGVVKELKVKVGDKVSDGSLILVLETADTTVSAPPPAQAAQPAAPTAELAPASIPASAAAPQPIAAAPTADAPLPYASPAVRKLAREKDVDLTKVKGTGPKDRITKEDVEAYAAEALAAARGVGSPLPGLDLPAWPKVDHAKFGPTSVEPLSRIRRLSGPNLARNWVMIPHVTNHDEADITELEAFRQQLNREQSKQGVKYTFLGFLIKAVVAALKQYPAFNASLDGDNLVLKHYYHIGFAADTPLGLVVPVIRDADRKGLREIAQETANLAQQAREGRLKLEQMQGGCFSISSLGGIGGGHFTPIVNAPEVAILGVGKAVHKPVWDGGTAFQPRLMLPLSLSYDHRVIDGALAARFNAFLGTMLADLRRVML
ncbi:MAG TPA: dihydrolipoyllysine-residue acetyltransferase [Thiobacillaceae bacterium]|nr:dihydrolipoyllysine-residue acetyltransferase [Thiobacillaceae bacterium]